MTQAEWYAQRNQEEAQRVDAAHELRMKQRRADMGASPGSFNPWEKKAVDDYFAKEEEKRRFDKQQQTARGQWGYTDEYGIHHAGGAEKVAEYGMQGQRDAGMGAAKINAEAAMHGQDTQLKGIEAQAANALEQEKIRQQAAQEIAKRNAETQDAASKREWGYFDEKGTFVPGGRVKVGEETAKAQVAAAQANNQAKIAVAQITAEGKERAAKLMGSDRIKAALAGNPGATANTEKLQQTLGALADQGLSDEQIAEFVEWQEEMRKKKGGQTATNTRTQGVNEEIRRRTGMGV